MKKQIEILEKKLKSHQEKVKNAYALANKIKKLKEKEKQNNWNNFLAQ
jgi:hypothetical protein